MTTFYCREVAATLAPTDAVGIGGAPTLSRSTALGGRVKSIIASYTTTGLEQSGDTLVVGPLNTMDKFFSMTANWDALGGSSRISLGKRDDNNQANTDPTHYLASTDASFAGTGAANANLGEEVGADQAGDTTTIGQGAPGYGAAPVWLTLTFVVGPPAAGANIVVRVLYIGGGQ